MPFDITIIVTCHCRFLLLLLLSPDATFFDTLLFFSSFAIFFSPLFAEAPLRCPLLITLPLDDAIIFRYFSLRVAFISLMPCCRQRHTRYRLFITISPLMLPFRHCRFSAALCHTLHLYVFHAIFADAAADAMPLFRHYNSSR